MDNVVANLCAKFDDDRLWNEKALVLITTRRTTFVALGDLFPGLKNKFRYNDLCKVMVVGISQCNLRGVLIIGVGLGAQSCLREQDIFARKLCMKIFKKLKFYVIFARKIIKMPEFLWYLREKINKIPTFYMTFARKNARILHDNCPKNIFRFLFCGGGGHVPSPVAVSYAYGYSRVHVNWLIQPRAWGFSIESSLKERSQVK